MKFSFKSTLKLHVTRLLKYVSRNIMSESDQRNRDRIEILSTHRSLTYGDQKGQVDFLINNIYDYSKNGLPFGGFFVDLACADGVEINNTFFLERHLGWKGILFEPNPIYFESIRNNRSSHLVTKCVTDTLGSDVTFRIDDGMSGGIVSESTDNNYTNRSKELRNAQLVTMKTTTLEHELDLAGAPKIIDFMSLDIEGAEWIVLKDFPFSKYVFRSIVIERPTPELDILLAKNGYHQVCHLMFDVFYVHTSYLKEVNLDPKIHFAFTPRKDF